MKKLPSKVRVGAVVYTVTRPARIQVDGRECWGSCDKSQAAIEIRADLPLTRAWATLRHELAHAAYKESGFEDSAPGCDDPEELLCDVFPGVYLAALEDAGIIRLVR